MLIIKSSTKEPASANPTKALSRASVTWVNWALFISSLILVKRGFSTESARFFIEVQICAHVLGIVSNLALVSSAAANMAFFTTSAVIKPSSAYFLMEPSATPIYCSMALAIPGAFSRMEFSSSPRKAPAPMAWVNCIIAAACPWAEAPPITNCLLICSIKAISSSFPLKADLAFAPMLAMALAVSK